MNEIETLLHEADYRQDNNGIWTKDINSHGLGLTAGEQEINRRGGRIYGKNAAEILGYELADAEDYLDQFDEEQIDDDQRLSWRRDWAQEARAALTSI